MTGGDEPPELHRSFMSDKLSGRKIPEHQGKRKAVQTGSEGGQTYPTEGVWVPLNEVASAT